MLVNTLGFLIGYLLYTPIGHGFTGNHGREMNTEQIFAHSVGLAVVALILFLLQKKVLNPYIKVGTIKILLAVAAFTGLFWFGYYQNIIPDGPDYDILFGFLVLGSGLWITDLSFSQNKIPWLVAVLSFPFASFIGELILFLIVINFELDMDVQQSMLDHTIFWVSVGLVTGILGGWISGTMLYKMIDKRHP